MVAILAEQELERFKELCTKVVQAYRIRMKLFSRREVLLFEIDRDYGKISNLQAFCSELSHILEQEKKLLGIVEGGEQQISNNIKYALSRFEAVNAAVGKLSVIRLPHNRMLSVREFNDFLLRMISFLRQMELDIEGIKTRMAVEENFVNEKTTILFMQYLKAWEEEAKANELMMAHLNSAFKSNVKMIEVLRDYWLAFGGVLTGVAGALSGFIGGNGIVGNDIISGRIIYIGVGLIIANVFWTLFSSGPFGSIDAEREGKVLRDLKKKAAFRNKLAFGMVR
jgi:hypothetical protein